MKGHLRGWHSPILLLFVALPLLLPAQIGPGQIVINEFMADNDNTVADQNGEFDDWVELYNNTSSPISLNGLYLTDDFMLPTKWPFPDTFIAPHDFLVVWADNDTFQAGLHAFFRLSTNGEKLWMGYNNGLYVDSLSFGPQGTGISYGRFPNGTGGFGSMNPTFSANNSPFLILDTLQRGEVVLNEFMAINTSTVPDQNQEYDDWIELYNNTSTAKSLQYLFLTDDPTNPTKWAFPDTSIAANDFLIIWADNDTFQTGLHAFFRLATAGDFLWMGYADGTVVDSIRFGTQLIDVSSSRLPNGTGDFQFAPPTFAAPNMSFPALDTIQPGELVLNEVMALNLSTQTDQDGEFEDWLELYNNTADTLDLGEVFLTDDSTDPVKWGFPDTTIAPNAYLIVWVDQDVAQAGLHASFSLSSTFGEQLFLGYADGTRIDQIQFGPQIADTTFGRFPNGTGPLGLMLPTFSAPNSNLLEIDSIQPGEIVINELMADNTLTIADQDLEYDDWIELYNPTSNPLSLSRVFLSDDPNNRTLWPFPDTAIAANGYLIIWADNDLNQSGLHANFSLSNNGERLFLGYGGTQPLDSVDFWPMGRDTTFGRFPNGTGEFGYMLPTFAASNSGRITAVDGLSETIPLQVFPNPATDILTLRLSAPAILTVRLIDPQGRQVRVAQVGPGLSLEIPVAGLPRGLYLLRVGESHWEKIMLR